MLTLTRPAVCQSSASPSVLPSPSTRPSSDMVTRYLGTADIVKIVQARGVSASLVALAEVLAEDFRRWPSFDKCPRVASHSPQGAIELMPIADATHYSFKYVNGHPGNPHFGVPTVMAFGVLADVATGAPRLLAEMSLATGLRTAATSALAARTLARPDSRVMALIGNGAQSEFQALAFQALLGIDTLRLYDVDPAATVKLVRNLQGQGFTCVVCDSIARAVCGADIVTTITADKTRATILTSDLIEPGMHLNAVGGDCPGKTELHPGVLSRAAVFVEFEPQTRIEGDLQQMPPDFAVTEIWQVLAGHQAGRRDAQQVTVFDSVGFAMEDFSVLRFLREAAETMGVGTAIDLVAQTPDPKDLFGLLVT